MRAAPVVEVDGQPLTSEEWEVIVLFRRLTPRQKQQAIAILEIFQPDWQPPARTY